jgi:acyl-CoA synthetase (AMP-forming)/AMP-acid ligase II
VSDGANVVELLKLAARRFPKRRALVMPGGASVTYEALWDRVDRASAGFKRLGLQPGARVICMVSMSVDLYVVLLGLLKAGGVAVFVDPWVSMRQIAAFAAFAEPWGFVGVPKSHLLRLLHPRLRRLGASVTTGSRLGRLPAATTIDELLAQPGDGAVVDRSSDDPALITFTSGSSGIPKGVNRTHGFLTAQHGALRAEFPYRDEDVDMPMFPVFALNNLALGMTSVIPDMDFRCVAAVNPGRILAQMAGQGVTTCTASPPFFRRLMDGLRATRGPRPALRRILTGGAPVSDEDLATWRHTLPGAEILVVYGSTEAEPVAHIEADARLQARGARTEVAPGYCLGVPSPRVAVRIVRIATGALSLGEGGWSAIEVRPGEVGELVVTGAHVCKDYFGNPAAVRDLKIRDRDGVVWHRMGDTVYGDDAGRLWLVGRVHSTIWRDGCAVHPQLVEQAARQAGYPGAAAVGMPDRRLGQRVVLVIRADGEVAGGALSRLAAAGCHADEVLATTRALPMDPRHNAKVDYTRLQAMIRKGKLAL